MSKYVFGSLDNTPIPFNDFSLRDAYNDDYMFKPEFVYHKLDDEVNPRYFGVELELELPNGIRETAKNVLRVVNDRPYFYFKYDGSVNNGCEMNSHPMSIGALNRFHELTSVFKLNGVKVNDSCGLHIHIDRSSFKNEKAVMNFYQNIIVSRKLMLWLSKRTKLSQVKQYADLIMDNPVLQKYDKGLDKFCYHRKELSTEVKFNVKGVIDEYIQQKGGGYESRYSGVNLRNSSTVEIRFLKGTTNWNLVMDYVRLFDFIANLSNKGVVVKSPYELIKLSMGTEVYDFLKSENDSYVEMNDKVSWLEENNKLFVSKSGNMFYRIPNKSMENHDYVVSVDAIERALRQLDNFDLNDKDDYLLNELSYQRRSSPIIMDSPKKYMVFRRVKSVAFIKDETENLLYEQFKKFLLYTKYSGFTATITSTKSFEGDVEVAISRPLNSDEHRLSFDDIVSTDYTRAGLMLFDDTDSLFTFLDNAVDEDIGNVIQLIEESGSLFNSFSSVRLEYAPGIHEVRMGNELYYYDTVYSVFFKGATVLALSNYYHSKFVEEIRDRMTAHGEVCCFDFESNRVRLDISQNILMVV